MRVRLYTYLLAWCLVTQYTITFSEVKSKMAAGCNSAQCRVGSSPTTKAL